MVSIKLTHLNLRTNCVSNLLKMNKGLYNVKVFILCLILKVIIA